VFLGELLSLHFSECSSIFFESCFFFLGVYTVVECMCLFLISFFVFLYLGLYAVVECLLFIAIEVHFKFGRTLVSSFSLNVH